MPRTYVDNAYNRSVGRVGMAHGTAVVSRSSGGGGGGGSSHRSSYGDSSSSSRSYVDNTMNRSLGRVGTPLGSAVHSRSSNSCDYTSSTSSGQSRSNVDNAMNRSLGRVGMPLGSVAHSRDSSSTSLSMPSTKTHVDNTMNRSLDRVGMPLGSAVHSSSAESKSSVSKYVDNQLNRKLGRVGLDKGTAVHSKSTGEPLPRTFADNAFNQLFGRVGQSYGSAMKSKYLDQQVKTYVDNAMNRRIGRVGKPLGSMAVSMGSMVVSKRQPINFERLFCDNEYAVRDYLDQYPEPQRTEILDFGKLRANRANPLPSKELLSRDQVINFDDLKIGEKVGGGGFADVHVCMWQGSCVAVKKLRVQRVHPNKLKAFEDEVRAISHLSHPNIVKFYGACVKTPNLAIIMEFMPDGSLYDNLHIEQRQFTDNVKHQMIRDALSALVYLHAEKLVHRDIKSKNIMLYESFTRCKLTDFGLALRDEVESNSTCNDYAFAGTEKYCPKEVLAGDRLTIEQLTFVDVYSLALTALELLAEEEPYDNMRIQQIRKAINEHELPQSINAIDGPKKVLLEQALSDKAEDRPTAKDFLSMFNEIAI